MLINTIEIIIITIEGHNRNNHQKAVHVLALFSLFSCDGGDGGDSGDWKSQIHDDYPTAILPQISTRVRNVCGPVGQKVSAWLPAGSA